MEIEAKSSTHAFMRGLNNLMLYGEEVVVNDNKTRELRNVSFHISDPMHRCLLLSGRNDNIFAKVAETVWVLSGRNDITWLENYLPRASQWSDDGKTWRGGYGPRLRNWKWDVSDADTIDQIYSAMTLINAIPNTRQAVNVIFDPGADYVASRDIPCNIAIHWLRRNGELDMTIMQRSSDAWWGFSGINLFEWSVLQQMMAYWTRSRVGKLIYNITSFHIYEHHWERAQKLLDKYNNGCPSFSLYETIPDNLGVLAFTVPFGDLDYTLHDVTKMFYVGDPLLGTFSSMLAIHKFMISGEKQKAIDLANSLPECELKYATKGYLNRYYRMEIFDDNITKQLFA